MIDFSVDDLRSPRERQRVIEALMAMLRERFVLVDSPSAAYLVPYFQDKQTGIMFAYIPAGSFWMGLSEAEERAARLISDPFPADIPEMRPVHRAEVKHFLLSIHPVTGETFRRFTHDKLPSYLTATEPAVVTFHEAMNWSSKLGCTLPAEVQWEYGCRATTQTLFVWGDSLPDKPTLDRWLRMSFAEGFENRLQCNQFGLYGLFVGEWCSDEYRQNYECGAPVLAAQHVVRGGGSMFWPWQAQEWVWCMSAMRMPESGLFADRRAGFRLAYSL